MAQLQPFFLWLRKRCFTGRADSGADRHQFIAVVADFYRRFAIAFAFALWRLHSCDRAVGLDDSGKIQH